MKRTWPAELNRSTPNGREVPAHCKAYPAPLHSRFPSFRANSATWWATPSLNVTKTAAVVIDSGPQNTVRFGAGPLRFGSQVVARRIDVFGPFRAVMAGRIGTWVARDCHIRASSCAASRTLSRPPPSVSIALLDGQPEWYIVLVTFTIEIEREDDGRWLAEVPALPGVLAYGQDPDESVARVQALALRVIAERLEHRETPAEFLNVSFQAA